ncbi:MAG: hypothetical protein LLG93_11715 [Deltaproteobacteria bacterium]|nr:hypothetical protein [Deltaproteobacteria bacterium]
MKILSFCLYGNKPMFDIGMIKNVKLAQEIYRDYECRVYLPKRYNGEIQQQIREFGGTPIEKSILPGHLCMMWRLLPCFEENIELVVSRDADARLTKRDYEIVNRFLETDYAIQSLKDHEAHHGFDLLGGMIAIKPDKMYQGFKSDYRQFILKGYKTKYPEYRIYGGNLKGSDQIFLSKYVFSKMRSQIIEYSDLGGNPIGALEDKTLFIGNKFDENDVPQFVRGY